MAQARAVTAHVPTTEGYALNLTVSEAETLLFLLQYVGGDPAGPRGRLTAIDEALRGAGLWVPASGLHISASVHINRKG